MHYTERREEIRSMLERTGRTKLDVSKLSERYGVSKRTIYNDFDAIKKECNEMNRDDLFFISRTLLEMCRNELRKMKDNTDNESVKLGAIKSLLNSLDKEWDWAERAGVIEKPVERIEINDEYNDKLIEIYEQLKDEGEDKE